MPDPLCSGMRTQVPWQLLLSSQGYCKNVFMNACRALWRWKVLRSREGPISEHWIWRGRASEPNSFLWIWFQVKCKCGRDLFSRHTNDVAAIPQKEPFAQDFCPRTADLSTIQNVISFPRSLFHHFGRNFTRYCCYQTQPGIRAMGQTQTMNPSPGPSPAYSAEDKCSIQQISLFLHSKILRVKSYQKQTQKFSQHSRRRENNCKLKITICLIFDYTIPLCNKLWWQVYKEQDNGKERKLYCLFSTIFTSQFQIESVLTDKAIEGTVGDSSKATQLSETAAVSYEGRY